MTGAKRYQTSLPGEREFTLTRTFEAPRRPVLDARARPVCEIDPEVGGSLRYVRRHDRLDGLLAMLVS